MTVVDGDRGAGGGDGDGDGDVRRAASAPAPGPRRTPTARYVALGVGAVLVVLIGAFLLQGDDDPLAVRSRTIGQPARPMVGESILDGQPFDLADADGRYTLVNFFAVWCKPCVDEHPELLEFAEEHADDARVVTVVLQDEPDNVRRFFEENGGEWPVLDDPQAAHAIGWGVVQPPESFLVGPEGLVRTKLLGGVTADELEALLVSAGGGS